MRTHQYYPLARRSDYGIVMVHGDKQPRAARFLTPEKAKALAIAAKQDLAA